MDSLENLLFGLCRFRADRNLSRERHCRRVEFQARPIGNAPQSASIPFPAVSLGRCRRPAQIWQETSTLNHCEEPFEDDPFGQSEEAVRKARTEPFSPLAWLPQELSGDREPSRRSYAKWPGNHAWSD